jgi:hypothetical protein
MSNIEPIKDTLEKACRAATELIKSAGREADIQLVEYKIDDTVSLYLKYNGEIVYKKTWVTSVDELTVDEAREVLFGSLLTELVATFCIIVTEHRQFQTTKGR